MKNNVKCILSFALGIGAGAIAGYKFYELKLLKELDQMDNKEPIAKVEEVIEHDDGIEVKAKLTENGKNYFDSVAPEINSSNEPSDKTNYATKLAKEHYVQVVEPEEVFVEKGCSSDSDIDIIPIEDFDQTKGFGCEYLTLYADGVVANDSDKVYQQPMMYIGEQAYNELLKGETTVCVRNFSLKYDYKIDRVDRPFYDESFLEDDETLD